MGEPETLYYSAEAVARFRQNENATRESLLGNLPFGGLAKMGAIALKESPAYDEVVQGPMFGAWMDQTSRAVYNAPRYQNKRTTFRNFIGHCNYVGNYALTAALLAGQDTEIPVFFTGDVMVPEFGLAVVDGNPATWIAAKVASGGLTLVTSKAKLHIPHEGLGRGSRHWKPLRYIGPADFRVALNDIDPNRNIFRWPGAPRLSKIQYEQWHAVFPAAMDILQQYDPQAASVVYALLNTIVPARAEPMINGKGMAAAAAFGAMGINENSDPMRLAVHMVFCARKAMAMALRGEYPDLYLPDDHPASSKPAYTPSQEGYKELYELQNDSFINISLARLGSGVARSPEPNLRAYGELSFTRWYAEARDNLQALRGSEYLHGANNWLVDLLDSELATLTDQFAEMPDAARRAAQTHALDHWISWRLYTVIPSTRVVNRLRDLWLDGRACPGATVPSWLRKDKRAYTEVGRRTRGVLAEMCAKDPTIFAEVVSGQGRRRVGMPTPGDIAFACGNIKEARDFFRAAIRQQPANPESWAGFAVTFASETSAAADVLKRQPEIVATLYKTIGDSTIDPEALAAWLAPSKVQQIT